MKKYSHNKFFIFFSSCFIFLLHLPFVFAKNKPAELSPSSENKIKTISYKNARSVITASYTYGIINEIYDSLKLNVTGLSRQAFQIAMEGFDYLVKAGKITNDKIISIVDFSQPSSKKRFFVIDLDAGAVLFNTYVAHGIKSGKEYASSFSNAPQSNKSSLGFYETMNTYNGKNGYSLHLQGLEKGINDNAGSRAIVLHGADYVSENLLQKQGYIGRSFGCPAVPEKLHRPIIDQIKNGTCLFIYSSSRQYFIHSRLLQEAEAMAAAGGS
jgi:hypothetical protein